MRDVLSAIQRLTLHLLFIVPHSAAGVRDLISYWIHEVDDYTSVGRPLKNHEVCQDNTGSEQKSPLFLLCPLFDFFFVLLNVMYGICFAYTEKHI